MTARHSLSPPPATRSKLVGVTEIAAMIGVSKQRAAQIADAGGFPKPVDEPAIAAGRIWYRSRVEKWARRAGRKIYAKPGKVSE